MTQTSGSIPHPIAPDYDGSLVLPIELSNASWVLAAQIPGLPCVKSKRTIEPTAEALLAAIEGYRDRARAAGRDVKRVIATYEASWSGFWLARWLARNGVSHQAFRSTEALGAPSPTGSTPGGALADSANRVSASLQLIRVTGPVGRGTKDISSN